MRPAESTNIHRRERTSKFVDEYGHLPIRAIDDEHVAAWIKGGRDLGTVQHLRTFFNDAATVPAGRLVAVHQGTRPGELDALAWEQIDFQAETILVDRQCRLDAATNRFWVAAESREVSRTPGLQGRLPIIRMASRLLRRRDRRQEPPSSRSALAKAPAGPGRAGDAHDDRKLRDVELAARYR